MPRSSFRRSAHSTCSRFPCPVAKGGGAAARPGDLPDSESVRLFVERAQATRADFALSEANAPEIAEICRRLDGLPLAIELAAARVRVFPPGALLDRLERRLPLLTGGARDAPQRLRTMRDAIGWSHDLLDADEQALFRRLAVFDGGFTLDAVEPIGMGTSSRGRPGVFQSLPVFDVLASLVEKSLVRQVEAGDDEPRFHYLETVREFGLEQLAAHDEAEAVGARHARWMLELVERAAPEMFGSEQRRWAERFERELPNLRAAFAWFVARGQADEALRLAGALLLFWFLRGHLREGISWLEQALALPNGGDAPSRGSCLGAVWSGASELVTWRLRSGPKLWRAGAVPCQRARSGVQRGPCSLHSLSQRQGTG